LRILSVEEAYGGLSFRAMPEVGLIRSRFDQHSNPKLDW